MNYRVQVRINKRTGEIEVFQVEDTGVGRRQAHDAAHDEVTERLGALVERRAEIEEVLPLPGVPAEAVPRAPIRHEQIDETPVERERLEN
ncbi:hypothetical protein [Actinoplanes sp. NPDC049118]|uniref:hypothetical protein n=1 Tax=Actinoplanes sp. NPDC049118 TaxID=3155769 RepID=UPI0033C8D67F